MSWTESGSGPQTPVSSGFAPSVEFGGWGRPSRVLPICASTQSQWGSEIALCPQTPALRRLHVESTVPSFKTGRVSKCGWRDNAGRTRAAAAKQHKTESKHGPRCGRDTAAGALKGIPQSRHRCKHSQGQNTGIVTRKLSTEVVIFPKRQQ